MGEFQAGEDLCKTPCHHRFHKQCLKSWVDKKIQQTFNKITESQAL